MKAVWKSIEEYFSEQLTNSINLKVNQLFESECKIKLSSAIKEKLKATKYDIFLYLLHAFAKKHYSDEYNVFMSESESIKRFNNVSKRIRNEIIIPELRNTEVTKLVEIFDPILHEWLNSEKLKSTWAPDEDLYLIEKGTDHYGNISNLNMPNRPLWRMNILGLTRIDCFN